VVFDELTSRTRFSDIPFNFEKILLSWPRLGQSGGSWQAPAEASLLLIASICGG